MNGRSGYHIEQTEVKLRGWRIGLVGLPQIKLRRL